MGRQTRVKTTPPRKKSYGCTVRFLGCLSAVVVTLALICGYAAVRYVVWYRQEAQPIAEIAASPVENREHVRSDMRARLDAFQGSSVQKSVLELDCDMFNVLIDDVAERNWSMSSASIGVACVDRAMKVYFNLWDVFWVEVDLWQRAEGSPDFVVYDVRIGPFSIAGLTLGAASSEMSEGVDEAFDLVGGTGFSGREIETIHIDKNGVKIAGIIRKSE